jgi:hypothetical protein
MHRRLGLLLEVQKSPGRGGTVHQPRSVAYVGTRTPGFPVLVNHRREAILDAGADAHILVLHRFPDRHPHEHFLDDVGEPFIRERELESLPAK